MFMNNVAMVTVVLHSKKGRGKRQRNKGFKPSFQRRDLLALDWTSCRHQHYFPPFAVYMGSKDLLLLLRRTGDALEIEIDRFFPLPIFRKRKGGGRRQGGRQLSLLGSSHFPLVPK